MKSFTIIIPTFNAENYIANCLNSILNLNYKKELIEVYVIDDGSIDKTSSIVKGYTEKFPYIKYIYKNNGQWGSVINYAKANKLVNNELVLIFDSDDILHKESLNLVNKKISNADIFFGTYQKWDGKKNRNKIYPFYYLFKRSTKNTHKMHTPVCIPLVVFFKNDLFYKLSDLTEKVAYQDSYLISQLINLSRYVKWTTKVTGYYYYNRSNNSMSQGWSDSRFYGELTACNNCLMANNQEFISYKLNVREFRRIYKAKREKFVIKRKFNFSWFPFYIRWSYVLTHLLVARKYFKLEKDKV